MSTEGGAPEVTDSADILVSRDNLYQTPIGYRVEDLSSVWRLVSGGTYRYISGREGFVKFGPPIGNLGNEPEIRFDGHGGFALKLGIGDSYKYNKAFDKEAIEKGLRAVLDEEVRVDGKVIYRNGERIAVIGDHFLYEPVGSSGNVGDIAHFAKALREGLEVYRVAVTELLKANGMRVFGDVVIVRPGGSESYELKHEYRNEETTTNRGEVTIGLLILPEKMDVTFGDIGGQKQAVEICKDFADMLRYPEVYEIWGSKPPRGILLFGPPGNGKTLIAKALAKESDTLFLYVKSSDIVGNGLYGDTERATAGMFEQAKAAATEADKHCILFIDEIDLMLSSNKSAGSRHEATGRSIGVFAQYMDGLVENPWLTVVASTNDPADIDPRILSRMEVQIEMPLLDKDGIRQVLEIQHGLKSKLAGRKLFAGNVDFDKISATAFKLGVSGRDISDAINTLLIKRGKQQLTSIIEAISSGKVKIDKPQNEAVVEAVKLIRNGEMGELVLPQIGTEELLTIISESKKQSRENPKGGIGFGQ